jgi:uncharacterized protein (TIGR00251 family)
VARITVTLSPGASRTELVGPHADGWRARVAAPPERGRANAALVALLAKAVGVPADRVRIAAGETARRKVIEIDGLDEALVARRLARASRDGGRVARPSEEA